jgi:hypothetical protein
MADYERRITPSGAQSRDPLANPPYGPGASIEPAGERAAVCPRPRLRHAAASKGLSGRINLRFAASGFRSIVAKRLLQFDHTYCSSIIFN